MAMVLVPRERQAGERRVALVPGMVKSYLQAGLQVVVEAGAGKAAGFMDDAYRETGAKIARDVPWKEAALCLTVRGLEIESITTLSPGTAVIGLLAPDSADFPRDAYEQARVNAFALERLPRISRAQSMDALSSQATAAGYRAALLAAAALLRFLPMLTTAAGTIRPARVLVIGTGVAGLQAIATVRRLGAVVEAYDVRAAAKEQVESLGARFVATEVGAEAEGGYARELTAEEKARQAEVLARHVAMANALITTAAVPGRPAPRIISKAMVESMAPGSVIVDLGASGGGNCEFTKPDKTTVHAGVTLIGPTNPASGVAYHASEMYARNGYNFVAPWFGENGVLSIPAGDEIYIASLVSGALPGAGAPADAPPEKEESS